VSYQHKHKQCITVQFTVASVYQISFGCRSQWIHCSMKPRMKYMESIHFMITKFSLFYFYGSVDFQTPLLMPSVMHLVTNGHSHVGNWRFQVRLCKLFYLRN